MKKIASCGGKKLERGCTGLADPVEIRRHPLFKALDWEQLKKQVPPHTMLGMVEVAWIVNKFLIHI